MPTGWDEWQRREEWHRNKFKTPGWRAGLAGTLPAITAIRWLVYAPGWHKLWAIAIFIGGMFLMRLLINLYDKLRGNPRRVYEKLDSELEEDRGAKTPSHIVDISFIVIGIALITVAALNNFSVMLIIGIVLAAIGLLFFFLRRMYVKRGKFPKGW